MANLDVLPENSPVTSPLALTFAFSALLPTEKRLFFHPDTICPLLPPKDQNKIAPIVEKATIIAIISSKVTIGLLFLEGSWFSGGLGGKGGWGDELVIIDCLKIQQ